MGRRVARIWIRSWATFTSIKACPFGTLIHIDGLFVARRVFGRDHDSGWWRIGLRFVSFMYSGVHGDLNSGRLSICFDCTLLVLG